MGDAVNLAARLMGHASKHGLGVLVDTATYMQTDVQAVNQGNAIEYEELPPVKLKGKASLIKMYRPKGMVHKREAARLIRDEGRTREIGELRERIASMHPVHAHTCASLTCVARAWHAQASCAR